MDAFGLPEAMREQIESSQAAPKAPDVFVVMEENAEAFTIFLECQTQWRYSLSGVTGMDYTAVLGVISLYSKKRRKQLFRDVRLIEQGALSALATKRERDD